MLIDKQELCSLIPHAGGMCLLDGVLSWTDTEIFCVSDSHLAADHPLRRNGSLSAVHLLEYGAQAMAVHGGLLARRAGLSLRDAYLAALRNVEFSRMDLNGLRDSLQINATRLIAAGENIMYAFTVDANGERLVAARATVIAP